MARTRSIDDALDSNPAPVIPVRQVTAQPSPESVATPAPPHPRVATATPTDDRPAATATATPRPDRPPVRTTVDLRADEYEAWLEWCAAAAKEVGRPRVHGQQVMRVLVRRLMADKRLAGQVTADIKKHAGQLNNSY